MRFGNCYSFAWQRYRAGWGIVLLRRSVKTWVIHAQWSPFGVPIHAVEVGFWGGLLTMIGWRRGYLLLDHGRYYWLARIDSVWVQEYLPPKWIDASLRASWWCRALPVHAALFFGEVRSGFGEEKRARRLIRRHWPAIDTNPEPVNTQPKESHR